ncbi:LysR family transcriptional regulator [Sneathiella limimaris]|uniref:LysR family transcriptional regulator n=1 Tax=Sneathiella limimaris TaxID=1964213 RepID=UPI001469BEB4|nr:LysR family transcriptional regulator [Sneathiella limimaris]
MNLRQMACYQAIFELKNLSHAASRLNLAQSAISHHLANLEEELGVPLFIRKPRGMEPTAAGIKLYEHVKSILRAVQLAEQDVRNESEEISGDIAIGLPHSVMRAIGLSLMQSVLRDFPKVRLSVVESLSGGTFANLLSSEVDLALFYNPQSDERISMRALLQEEVLCVGKREIIGNSDKPLAFDELANLPVLLLREGLSTRAVVDRPGLLNKLEARIPLQLNSINGIMTGLKAGLGCTLAPQVFVAEDLEKGELHSRKLVGPTPTRRLYFGNLKERPSTRLMEAMTELILHLIFEEVDSGRWSAQIV